MEKKRALGAIGVMVGILGLTGGCRELAFEGSRRIQDDHVLAGRPASSGGSALTTTERAQGFFVSNDEALSRLQTDLRERLDLRISLKSAVKAFANGNAVRRDPRVASPMLTSGPVTLATQLAPDLNLPAILNAGGELDTLCNNPLLAGVGSCGADLSSLNSLPIDDLHLDLDAANIAVAWDAPDPTIDLVPDAPVLKVSVPFSLDLDPNDFLEALIVINLQRMVVELRFQPQVCADASCRTFGREIFSNYVPGSSVRASLAGVDVRVTSRLESRNYEIIPTPLCFLPGVEGPLQPFFPVPPGAGPATCIGIATTLLPERIESGLAQAASAIADVVDPLLNPPALALPTAGLPSWLSVDPSRVFFRTNAATIGGIASPSRTLAMAAANGAWTNDTIDIVARGAQFSHVTLDLSSSPIPAACAGPFGGLITSQCTALCGGSTSTCAMTNAKICFQFSPGSTTCTGGLGLTRAQFESLLGTLAALPASGFTATSTEISGFADRIQTATAPIPSLPNLATIFDAAPVVANTVQKLFTRPLEHTFGSGAFYSAIVDCPASGPRPGACPDGVNGPVFEFIVDSDRDGIPNDMDNCPTDASVINVNSDGDGWCDENDLCPFTVSGSNTSYYCHCDADGDGCNNELVSLPIESAPPSVPRSCAAGPGGIHDERPTRSDHGADTDTDGITNDCDPDDDADGVDDPVDNCPDIPNPNQADYNSDGHGNVCDPLCPGPGAPCPDPDASGGFDFDAMEFDFGARIIPGCLADGPGCWGFFQFLCGGDGTGCFDDLVIDVWQDGFAFPLTTFGGELLDSILVPDLNQDGIDDLLIAVASTNGRALRAIDATNGALLWEQKSSIAGFGGSLAFVNGVIAVGSPDASVLSFYSFDGKAQGSVQGPVGSRLGAMLGGIGNTLYAGAPGGDPTKPGPGRLYAVNVAASNLTLALDGAAIGGNVGTMPIVGMKFEGKEAAVVASTSGQGAGRLYVLERDGDKLGKVLAFVDGEAGSELGASISEPGDFDGDGNLELAIGAPGFENDRGTLYFLASDGKLTPTTAGSSEGSRFGARVVRLGDLNEDGLPELGVSLPGLDIGDSKSGSHAVFTRAKKK